MMHNRRWTWIGLLVLLTAVVLTATSPHTTSAYPMTFVSPASVNDYPECPPNSDTIWVDMQLYGDPDEDIINVPFEIGFDETDADGSGPDFATGDVNYVTGVLFGEIHPVPDVLKWSPESIRAMSVAARTLAYDWCGNVVVGDHVGVDDNGKQKYRPHYDDPPYFDESEKERYRVIEETTSGIHMAYAGDVFDVKYRSKTGSRTDSGWPNPPHMAVEDPVGANYDPARNPGLAQINADHWASGSDPTPDDRFHPPWPTYQHILIHYYTGIHIRDASENELTPTRRWNPLSLDWHNPPDNKVPIMHHSQSYQLTAVVQNTSVYNWYRDSAQYYAFSYLGKPRRLVQPPYRPDRRRQSGSDTDHRQQRRPSNHGDAQRQRRTGLGARCLPLETGYDLAERDRPARVHRELVQRPGLVHLRRKRMPQRSLPGLCACDAPELQSMIALPLPNTHGASHSLSTTV